VEHDARLANCRSGNSRGDNERHTRQTPHLRRATAAWRLRVRAGCWGREPR
jgi:hypothetical protein